jgi:hypothetical protein
LNKPKKSPVKELKSKVIKSSSTQERVMNLLLYLLEAEKPVPMRKLEALYGGGEESGEDKRRTIFRHLDILSGYGLEIIRGDKYGIKKKSEYLRTEFNLHESQALYFAAQEAISDVEMRRSIQQKLLQIFHSNKKRQNLLSKRTIDLVEFCDKQINQSKRKYQMRLLNYSSANQGTKRDRLVVPVSFSLENLEIYAIDLEDLAQVTRPKVFKLDRCEGILKLKDLAPKELQIQSHKLTRDPFGYLIYDQELLHIEAYFNLKAMTIFLLHFPYLTDQFQYLDTEVDKPFLLTLDIVRVEPIIGVFSVLLNHIRFENSDEFLSAWKVFHQANVEGSLERLWEK